MKNLVYIFFIVTILGCSKLKIGKFAIFETEIQNLTHYQNPYSDVDLKVHLESPDGRKIEHYGFYDGENTWKIRFMPDKTGVWNFTARFSDFSKNITGSFECLDSNLKGQIKENKKNPIWFETQNNEPFLVRSFHAGDRFFAQNWSDSARQTFLNWAVKNKYNTLSVASFFTNRQSEGRGLGWDTPEIWPLNFEEFRKAESILNQLHKKEIYIFPFAGFFGRNGNWPTNHKEQEQYIKYILARWGAYSNLLFNVAGPEPLLDGKPEHKAGYNNQMEIEDINRLANLIKKYDAHNHLITVHNQTSASKNGDPFIDFKWCGFSTIQGPKTPDLKLHQKTVAKIRNPEKPYYAQETLWGGNMYHPDYGAENIRKIAIVLSVNAAMINFADNNGNSSSGFSGSLNPADCKQFEHDALKVVWDFMETIPFNEMKPDTTIAPGKFVLAGEKEILIYSEKQDSFLLNIDNSKLYRAEWINAQNPAEKIELAYLDFKKPQVSPYKFFDCYLRLYVGEKK